MMFKSVIVFPTGSDSVLFLPLLSQELKKNYTYTLNILGS